MVKVRESHGISKAQKGMNPEALFIPEVLLTVFNMWFAECTCHTPGTVNGSNVCEPDEEGYCLCKKNVEGARCMSCKDTYYDLREENIYGCTGKYMYII